jgi:recombination protein RecR
VNLIPIAVDRLTQEFARLPGVGPKTAQRLTFHCVDAPGNELRSLAAALESVVGAVHACNQCFFMSDGELCAVCQDQQRDQTVICVVEQGLDVLAIERSGEYRGLYHVLGGSLSPIAGVGPDQLRVRELEERIAALPVTEVVLATDPDVEGEATSHYLADRLASFAVAVTRLAHGLPAGSDLQYADELTLARALTGRRSL